MNPHAFHSPGQLIGGVQKLSSSAWPYSYRLIGVSGCAVRAVGVWLLTSLMTYVHMGLLMISPFPAEEIADMSATCPCYEHNAEGSKCQPFV